MSTDTSRPPGRRWTTPAVISGTRGSGIWATQHDDDGQQIVTVYDGWGITDEMTFSGIHAADFAAMAVSAVLSA